MTINTDMARRIHAQITTRPETHNQHWFDNRFAECGTTRCVAGWAIYFTALDRGYEADLDLDQLASRYVQERELSICVDSEYGLSVSDVLEAAAADILGISEATAFSIFYEMNAAKAVEYVAELAAGNIHPDLQED